MSYPHQCQIWWHRPAPIQHKVSAEFPTAGSSGPSPSPVLGSTRWRHGPRGCRVNTSRVCPGSVLFAPYLCLEAFHQDGHQQVEEHVVAKGHQGHKVKGSPGGGGSHAVVQDHIPVLLCQDLGEHVCRAGNSSGPTRRSQCTSLGTEPGVCPLAPWGFRCGCPWDTWYCTWNTVTMAHSRESKFFLSGTVSPESVFRLNLQPNRCMPRMLRGMGTEWEGPSTPSA